MHPLTYYVDESIKAFDGNDICALIAIKTVDQHRLTSLIRKSIDRIISDPVLSQHNGINTTWIPHYCNDHPFEVHPQFLRDIAQMPFEAYIVYGQKRNLPQVNEYDWYDNLVKILFSFRMTADKGLIEKIVYEQHDSKLGRREAHLKNLIETMAKKDARRRRTKPSCIRVESAGKDALPLCLPDYIGGSFMAYQCETGGLQSVKRREFELVVDKIRWIKNADNGKIYTSVCPYKKD